MGNRSVPRTVGRSLPCAPPLISVVRQQKRHDETIRHDLVPIALTHSPGSEGVTVFPGLAVFQSRQPQMGLLSACGCPVRRSASLIRHAGLLQLWPCWALAHCDPIPAPQALGVQTRIAALGGHCWLAIGSGCGLTRSVASGEGGGDRRIGSPGLTREGQPRLPHHRSCGSATGGSEQSSPTAVTVRSDTGSWPVVKSNP